MSKLTSNLRFLSSVMLRCLHYLIGLKKSHASNHVYDVKENLTNEKSKHLIQFHSNIYGFHWLPAFCYYSNHNC